MSYIINTRFFLQKTHRAKYSTLYILDIKGWNNIAWNGCWWLCKPTWDQGQGVRDVIYSNSFMYISHATERQCPQHLLSSLNTHVNSVLQVGMFSLVEILVPSLTLEFFNVYMRVNEFRFTWLHKHFISCTPQQQYNSMITRL